MHPQYTAFIKKYKFVSRFCLDFVPSEAEPDEDQRTLPIGPKEFLGGLYIRRSVEQALLNRIFSPSAELTCFVGPRGAGKTSVAAAVRSQLQERPEKDVFVTYIDARFGTAVKEHSARTPDELEAFLRDTIINYYLFKLFPFTEEDPEPRLQLWEFLLSPRSEKEKPLDLFGVFRIPFESAQKAFSRFRTTKGHSQIAFGDWLREHYKTDTVIQQITDTLDQKVDIGHLVYAARFLHGFSRQVIWVDNIDALPEILQPLVIRHLLKFQLTITIYTATIAAVREENVYREEDITEEDSPPYENRVLLEIPRDTREHTYYPSVDIPAVKLSTLREIIEKRMVLARDLLRADVNSGILPAEMAISDQRWQHLRSLTDRILDVFDSVQAVFLANNCVRDLMFIHRDFLAYLLASTNEEREPPEAMDYELWYLATLFHAWVRTTKRKYQIGPYDAIRLAKDWHRETVKRVGCFLPYLVTTCIWNFCIENKGKTPTIGEVVKRLAMLGYDREDILADIFDLYSSEERRAHIVGIRSGGRIRDWKSLKKGKHLLIYVTYRGKCLALRAGMSFGFIAECIRRDLMSEKRDHHGHPGLKDTEEVARQMLPYLCDIAEMHYQALVYIRDKWSSMGATWFDNYLRWFGLPQEWPYRRTEAVGERLDGARRALYFDTLMSSLSGYVRHYPVARQFVKLSALYNQAVQHLRSSSDASIEPINFRQAMGFSPTKDNK